MIDVKKYDYFAGGKEDFYKKLSQESIESVLCQGSHWKKPPFVTIILTTYKRPEMLKQALDSALDQKGFDDYQIIVADNEGKPLEEETPTAKLLKNYQNDKIIYYRHVQGVLLRTDSAVRLARSPWIVPLHDDDLLAANHLAIMTGIVKKHKEIKFLGCRMKSFSSEQELEMEKKSCVYDYVVGKNLKDTTCLGGWAGWLGSLISRKHYIATGGEPTMVKGIPDMIMVAKFLHRFGTYKCISNKPLYYYRQGEQQASFEITLNGKIEKSRVEEYQFYKYVINKYHKLTHRIWERNIAYTTLEVCERYSKSKIYHAKINIDRVISESGMPADVKEKNFRYHITKGIFGVYRKWIQCLDDVYVGKLKKSDIHIIV